MSSVPSYDGIINTLASQASRSVSRQGGIAGRIAPEQTGASKADSVELSPEARAANQSLKIEPGIRADLVARIKAQIAAGDYDSPERIAMTSDIVARKLRDQA
jgi:anti-sigma28 factor (negative regulator of flagellin synthesis)